MTDSDAQDGSVPWIADQSQHPDELPDSPQVDAIAEQESEIVTFVSNRPVDDTTTTWITADADVLVDLSEAH